MTVPNPSPQAVVEAVVQALHLLPDDDTMEDSARRILKAVVASGELVPRATHARLEEALRFYADAGDEIYRGHDPAILTDRGARARQALGDEPDG